MMEFKLQYPAIADIAAIRVIISLWTSETIITLMQLEHMDRNEGERQYFPFKELETLIKARVSRLALPECLKHKVSMHITSVGMEIFNWRKWHLKHLNMDFIHRATRKLSWTCLGTVDTLQTAKCIVKSENLDVEQRYLLACLYSLEENIYSLWNQLPDERLAFYRNTTDQFAETPQFHFWTTCNLRRDSSLDVDIYIFHCAKLMFKLAVIDSDLAAMKYFRSKLNDADEAYILDNLHLIMPWLRINQIVFHKYVTDCTVYLLRTVNDRQRENIFQNYPFVLHCFTNWPYQQFFIEISRKVGQRLHPKEFYDISTSLCCNRFGFTEINYSNLFRQFWCESSDAHKKFLIIRISLEPELLWYKLVTLLDVEMMRIILESATPLQKFRILLCNGGPEFCLFAIKKRHIKLMELYKDYFLAIEQYIQNSERSADVKKTIVENCKTCYYNISILVAYIKWRSNR